MDALGSTSRAITTRWLMFAALAGALLGACQVDNDAASQIAGHPGLDGSAPSFAGVESVSDVRPTSLRVNWQAANDNGGTPPAEIVYRVYMAGSSGSQTFSGAGDASTTGASSLSLGGLTHGNTYCVVVRAQDLAQNLDGNLNEECVLTPLDSTAPAFAGISGAALTQPAPPQITLSWPAALDDASPNALLRYDIYRAETYGAQDFTTPQASVTGATGYLDSAVAEDRVYYYVVRAVDESGNSDFNTVQLSAATPYNSTGATQVYYPGLQPYGQMGAAASLLDWDGDGLLDLAIGAPETGNPTAGTIAYQAGQVSIYPGLTAGGFATDPLLSFHSTNSIVGGRFGRALASCDIRDDGTADDLVVGASGERRVYIYLSTAGVQDTTPDRIIAAPTLQGDTDEFGEAIACDRFNGTGGEDLVVAAPGGDTGGANTGRLFIYNNNSTGGLIDISGPEAAYFRSPSADFGAGTQPFCGRGLALADFDGDTIADLVVGCPFADTGGTNDGIVGFYKKAAANDTDDWAAAGSMIAPNNNDRWGEALAAGNFDDSLPGTELAVGQAGYDSPGANAGAVHLYGVSFPGPNFALSSVLLTIPDSGPNGAAASFGRAVAGGDVGGAGVDDLVVGAPEEDLAYAAASTASDIGTFYHFSGTPGSLMDATPEQADFNTLLDGSGYDVPGGTYNMRFGYGLCTGDINNDGRADVMIGAENDPTDRTGAGRLYVWYSVPTGEIDLAGPPGAVLSAPGLVVNKRFGTSCLVMDYNGDSLNDLLVGAQYADDNAADQGAVYVYPGQASVSTGGSDTGSVPVAAPPSSALFVPLDTGTASHYFGKALAACDLTGDGFPELIIGARQFDGATTGAFNPRGSTNEGAVFIYPGSGSGIDATQFQAVFPTDQNVGLSLFGQPGYSDNNFGYAVACAATVTASTGMDLVVGAPFAAKSSGNGNQGMVAIFHGAVNEDPSAYCLTNDFVGTTCLIEDTRDVRIDDQGPIANDDSWFGSALAVGDWDGLDGADLVVGSGRARLSPPGANNNGGVYAFRGAAGGGFLDVVGGVPLATYAYIDPTDYVDNRYGDSALALTDINNNGVPELLVGAWLCSYDDAIAGRRGSSTGCVFVDRGDYRP